MNISLLYMKSNNKKLRFSDFIKSSSFYCASLSPLLDRPLWDKIQSNSMEPVKLPIRTSGVVRRGKRLNCTGKIVAAMTVRFSLLLCSTFPRNNFPSILEVFHSFYHYYFVHEKISSLPSFSPPKFNTM